jgi:hypothetical protein
MPYFLCDRLADSKPLKTVLGLEKAPKLRKARIIGYQRATGNAESIVVYDGYNFGEWSSEEFIKGVVFEASNSEEERKLLEYVGDNCEINELEIEVACSSLLGNMGKMTMLRARIFVPTGEGDTLVGSLTSRRGSVATSEIPFGGGMKRGVEAQAHDSEERNTYRIALEAQERIDREQYSELEHPRPQNPHSTGWSLESALPPLFFEQLDIGNAHQGTERGNLRNYDDATAEVGTAEKKGETREKDKVGVENSKEDDKLGTSAAQGEHATPSKTSGSVIVTADTPAMISSEKLSPVPETQSTPKSRKEPALRPVRPELLLPQTPKKNSTRPRKTSDSIQSIVIKYEGLSTQNSPTTTPQKKA